MNAKAVLKKERSYREDKTRAFTNVLQYKVKNAIFLVVENQTNSYSCASFSPGSGSDFPVET